jgi:hypothetical protein
MNMADDALAGRHADGKAVRDRMAGLILGNRRVDVLDEPAVGLGGSQAEVAEFRIRPAVDR